MKTLLLFSSCILFSFLDSQETHSKDVLEHFEKFQHHHNRRYRNHEERQRRLGHFAKNHRKVAQLNAEARLAGRNVTFGLNKFADKNREELHLKYSKIHPGNHSDLPIFKSKHRRHHNRRGKRQSDEIPDNFDLRDVNINGNSIIGPVKNQEQCGCCWAFATTAITETANTLHQNQFTSLSDQEICDCADSGNTPGCVGGDPRNGLRFVSRNGQSSDLKYPYEEFRANTTGNCVSDEKPNIIGADSMKVYRFDEDYAEEDIIENLYYNHLPSAVYFRVGDHFEWYQGGIIESEDCYKMNPAEYHSAAIIGYGSDPIPYWVVRNSWNDDWGEDGYVRIRRGIDWCMIESHPATAIIE